MKIKKIFLSLLLVISFFFLSAFTTLAESETIDGETYFNDYFNYEWDFYKFDLTDDDINLVTIFTYIYVLRIDVRLPNNALIDGSNTPLAIYSFNGYKLKYGNIVQNAQRYNVYEVKSGTEIVVNISINKNSIDNYLEDNNLDPQSQYEFNLGVAEYINQYFVVYYAKTDGYDAGYEDGYHDGHRDGYDEGNYDGYFNGYDNGYDSGYDDGYNEGYDVGYNDFNVVDYFGEYNIAKAIGIDYALASDPYVPSTSIVVYNVGHSGPNILLDKPYIIVIIKKDIYDYVAIRFNDSLIYDYNATYLEIGDYDVYIFDFLDRLNTKYNLEIRKENVTTEGEAQEFLNDVIDNIYFSHASKLLTSYIALQFYDFGYIAGLEEMLSENEAYQFGYENGYNWGYINGNASGYEQGYEEGYDEGFEYGKSLEYKDGYEAGYNEGARDSFISKLDIWIVPAIILVLIAGIFVGYRKERYGG